MKKIFLAIASVIFLMVVTTNAQSYKKTELGIKSIVNSVNVEIQFYGPSTVRVLKSPEGKTFTKKSLSVVETPQETAFSIKLAGDNLLLESKNIQVELNLKNGKILFATAAGEPSLREKESGIAFTNFNDAGVKTYSVSKSFILDKGEAIYGLGQQQHGKMDQRNDTLHMIEGNTDDYIPLSRLIKSIIIWAD